MTHLQIYTKTITVNHGKTQIRKRVGLCPVHGEFDLFLNPNFEKQHGNCVQPQSGAEFESPKTLKAAA